MKTIQQSELDYLLDEVLENQVKQLKQSLKSIKNFYYKTYKPNKHKCKSGIIRTYNPVTKQHIEAQL